MQITQNAYNIIALCGMQYVTVVTGKGCNDAMRDVVARAVAGLCVGCTRQFWLAP